MFLTSADGAVTDKYAYGAWGSVTSHLGSTNQPYQYVGQMGYTTHYQDAYTSGLCQLGVRYYDPSTGRLTQRDPVNSDVESPYAYVSSRPFNAVDPTGEVVEVRRGGIHVFICINNSCWGFYPKSEVKAAADCCSRVPSILYGGVCCDDGEVRDDKGKGSGSKVISSRKSSKMEEQRVYNWIQDWRKSPHRYCLLPFPGLSDNCITFASKAFGVK